MRRLEFRLYEHLVFEPVIARHRETFRALVRRQRQTCILLVVIVIPGSLLLPVSLIAPIFGVCFLLFAGVIGFLEFLKFRVFNRDLRERRGGETGSAD